MPIRPIDYHDMLKALRLSLAAHKRAAESGKLELAEEKLGEARDHADKLTEWMGQGGYMPTELDRWA